jgi:hypothetical protein
MPTRNTGCDRSRSRSSALLAVVAPAVALTTSGEPHATWTDTVLLRAVPRARPGSGSGSRGRDRATGQRRTRWTDRVRPSAARRRGWRRSRPSRFSRGPPGPTHCRAVRRAGRAGPGRGVPPAGGGVHGLRRCATLRPQRDRRRLEPDERPVLGRQVAQRGRAAYEPGRGGAGGPAAAARRQQRGCGDARRGPRDDSAAMLPGTREGLARGFSHSDGSDRFHRGAVRMRCRCANRAQCCSGPRKVGSTRPPRVSRAVPGRCGAAVGRGNAAQMPGPPTQ